MYLGIKSVRFKVLYVIGIIALKELKSFRYQGMPIKGIYNSTTMKLIIIVYISSLGA